MNSDGTFWPQETVSDALVDEVSVGLVGLEVVVGLLVEATAKDAAIWDEEGYGEYGDELLAIDPRLVARMSARLFRGYVASLVGVLAGELGVGEPSAGRTDLRVSDEFCLIRVLRRMSEVAGNAEACGWADKATAAVGSASQIGESQVVELRPRRGELGRSSRSSDALGASVVALSSVFPSAA